MTDTDLLDALERMAWQQPHALAIVPVVGARVNAGRRMIELQPLRDICVDCIGAVEEPKAHGTLREAIDAECREGALE